MHLYKKITASLIVLGLLACQPVCAAVPLLALPGRVQSEWFALIKQPRLSYDRVLPPSDVVIVTKVIIRGAISCPLKKQLAAYAAHLVSTGGKPLNKNTFERYLLLMNDLPGVSVQPRFESLADTAAPADHKILLLQAQQHKGTPAPNLARNTQTFLAEAGTDKLTAAPASRIHYLSIAYDNRSPYALGEQRLTLDLNANALFGATTRTGYRIAVDEDMKRLMGFQVRHSFALGSSGGRVYVAFRQIRTKLRDFWAVYGIRGKANVLRLIYTYPVLRGAQQNVYLDAGFKVFNSRLYSHIDDVTERVYRDKIRAIKVGIRHNNIDPFLGMNTVALHVWQGFDVLNASKRERLSRPGAKISYTKLTTSLSRLQSLGTHFALLLAASGQYSFNALSAAEEFGFGGFNYGRGYEPSNLLGDSGFATKAELRLNSLYGWYLLRQVQWFTYYDIARLWNRRNSQQVRKLSGSSAGIGARMQFSSYLSGNVEIAKTLTRDNALRNPNGTTVYFNLTAFL